VQVLVVNPGSSSLKLRVLDPADGVVDARDVPAVDGRAELAEVEHFLAQAPAVAAAGVRLVHGGASFRRSTIVDAGVRERLQAVADLAPLHNPPALDALRALHRLRPALPVAACFDTAFFADLPAAAATYALPWRWIDQWGIRRFGFHGLSVQWASEQVLADRLVVCHLGGGCSVTAVRAGRSIDTSMGFTTLDGVPMATRAGSLDPGILLHLLRHGVALDELDHALEHESGLLGLSGRSGDVRELEGSEESAAALALDVFAYRVAGAVASMAAALGGLDALVFTAGIGEHSANVRARICERLAFLGVELDAATNASASSAAAEIDIEAAGAAVRVVVVRAREDIVAARLARQAFAR
jgi:acetate kinase